MAYIKKDIKKVKQTILDGISNGKSLKSLKDTNKSLPSRTIVYQWLNKLHKEYDEVFMNNYTQAREDSADLDAETVIDIAEKTLKGEHDPAAARVAIDAYKWTAGKKKPKKYGEKLDVTSGGEPIKQTPITVINNGKDLNLDI